MSLHTKFMLFDFLLSQAKQLCLAIARTNILERRPVSMVARAIDILVTSYSYSLKTGSHFKGMKAEKNSTSGVPQVDSPSPVTVDSASRVDSHGKSVHESASGVHNESISRSSTFSGSNSEDNEIIKPQKTTPVDRHSVGGKGESEMQMGPESHSKRFHQSPLQSQLLGPGNNQSNANVTNHQESQVISAAISPDEMYSYVFAPVEEEIGDSSYLVAIIVEFLRRYAPLVLFVSAFVILTLQCIKYPFGTLDTWVMVGDLSAVCNCTFT